MKIASRQFLGGGGYVLLASLGYVLAAPNFFKLEFAQPWLSERIKEGSTQ
jgi:hypothetical protein